jgi:hypothetical protein
MFLSFGSFFILLRFSRIPFKQKHIWSSLLIMRAAIEPDNVPVGYYFFLQNERVEKVILTRGKGVFGVFRVRHNH